VIEVENKTDATLSIVTEMSGEQLNQYEDYLKTLGFENAQNWQVIVKYNGDIQAVAIAEGGVAQIISSRYAVLTLPKENIKNLLLYTQVEYLETPKRMIYNISASMISSCITQVQNQRPYLLRGNGVLLGIIDSGINYSHPDFRYDNGETRIAYIWDQTISGNPPEGFLIGTEYTREQINEALSKPTRQEQLAIVPSDDFRGHGTHVAGIAGGNGRASNGQYVGAAPEAEFIIVKLGAPGQEDFVRSVEIMLAVKYVIEKAMELGKPIAINISLGMSEGPHDGTSLLEQYLDDAALLWRCNIVVGAGNEGAARNHTMGVVEQGGINEFQFQIGESVSYYKLSIWISFIDNMEFEIVSPSGASTGILSYPQGAQSYILGSTEVFTTFVGPSPLNGDIEFAVFLIPLRSAFISPGVWTVRIYGREIVLGDYHVWGPTSDTAGIDNYILTNVSGITITTPATAQFVISVGAYNSRTQQIAPFSGRGFSRDDKVIKPDLVAPGVNIIAPSYTGGYQQLSGTSMATPHVTGSVALIMEWGIVRGNNLFMYGENLKAYLLRGAVRNIPGVTFPNPSWGYGKLCLQNTLDILRTQQII
jgi:minor extracellular serine protease Vpr